MKSSSSDLGTSCSQETPDSSTSRLRRPDGVMESRGASDGCSPQVTAGKPGLPRLLGAAPSDVVSLTGAGAWDCSSGCPVPGGAADGDVTWSGPSKSRSMDTPRSRAI